MADDNHELNQSNASSLSEIPSPPTSPAGAASMTPQGDHSYDNTLHTTTMTTTISPTMHWDSDASRNELAQALLEASTDEDLCDVFLVASDGTEVPASRFVLAARSKVLKRMLYGSFREAKSSTICMMGYETPILQGIVEYCRTNQLPRNLVMGNHKTSMIVDLDETFTEEQLQEHIAAHTEMDHTWIRRWVRLYQAADFLELSGLEDLVDQQIRRVLGNQPSLACAVWDEVDNVHSAIAEYALQMLEVRPYVALKAVEVIRFDRLYSLFKSHSLLCGEFYLFRMLRQWYDSRMQHLGHNVDESTEYEKQATQILESAHKCAKCVNMENIEPSALLETVQACPFVNPTVLFDAFAKQALRASQNRVWSLSCRSGGSRYEGVERVLVEGCGSVNANGMYFRIVSGLKNGATLYTKKEVMCGQATVFTLSCRIKEEQVECRIFCSPLLTPHAVADLHRQHLLPQQYALDPLFQPVLQVVGVQRKPKVDLDLSSAGGLSTHKITSVVLSDGDYCLPATMSKSLWKHHHAIAESVIAATEDDWQINAVVQVQAFRMYTHPVTNKLSMYIRRYTVVNSNAGQIFGTPRPFSLEELRSTPASTGTTATTPLLTTDTTSIPTIMEEPTMDTDMMSSSQNSATISNQNQNSGGYSGTSNTNNNPLLTLYSCSYPLEKQTNMETKIPRSGWLVEGHGQGPEPVCTWFPSAATLKKNSQSRHSPTRTHSGSSALHLPWSGKGHHSKGSATSPTSRHAYPSKSSLLGSLTTSSISAVSSGVGSPRSRRRRRRVDDGDETDDSFILSTTTEASTTNNDNIIVENNVALPDF